MTSGVRQNWHSECEAALNKLANLELQASYVYLALAYHFDRDDVAMNGFSRFFLERSHSENRSAEETLAYQNQRGGRIVLQDIQKPSTVAWNDGLAAMHTAIEVEKLINQAALDLHGLADQHQDAQLSDWVESNFLQQKVEIIKKIGDHTANLRTVGPGYGEYLFDRETLAE